MPEEVKGDLIAQAYQATKADGDPEWSGVSGQFREKLQAHADAVRATGVTQTPFEREYKKLYQEDAANQDNVGPLATDSTPSLGGALDRATLPDKEAEEAAKPVKRAEAKKEEAKSVEAPKSASHVFTQPVTPNAKQEALHAMNRTELDAEAKKLGLNPDDYKNRDEILKAIEAKQK